MLESKARSTCFCAPAGYTPEQQELVYQQALYQYQLQQQQQLQQQVRGLGGPG
jgi:hypothetical protein